MQRQASGSMQPVFYFSQRTTPAESKYSSFELECLAVIYALKRFHIYLAGLPFTIITDCDRFRLTLAKRDINPRISRWAMYLQSLEDYKIIHKSGNKMHHVDALSRVEHIMIIDCNSIEHNLEVTQCTDPYIGAIKSELESHNSKDYELRDGLVYRKHKGKLLFFVPRSMEHAITFNCHDKLGHIGVDKTLQYIEQVYWFLILQQKSSNISKTA